MKVCIECDNSYEDSCNYCGSCEKSLNEENTLYVDLKDPQQYYLYKINKKLEHVEVLHEYIDDMQDKVKSINFVANFFFYLKLIAIICAIAIIALKITLVLEIINGISKLF